MSGSRKAIAILLMALACISHADAQVTLEPAGVDLGVGLGVGRGGGLRNGRDGAAAAGLLAWRFRSSSAGSPVVAFGGSAQAPIHFADDCLITPNGGCAPNYPGMAAASMLAGWEARTSPHGATFRLLAGLTVARSTERAVGVGLQGRVDIATPSLARLALVGWAQGTNLPSLRGDTYRMGSAGLGMRVR